MDRNNLYITKGTRTKSTYLIPINHINGIIIENTFPKRLFSYVSIKIIDQADMLDRKRNSQILFPIIHKKRAQTLLQHIHPQFAAFQTEKTHTVSTKALFLQMIQPSYSFVIVLVLINYFSPEYLLVPIVYGLALIIIRLIKTKQTKYMYTNSTVRFQLGIFHTKLFFTTWEKIDQLTITQTYLEKKLNVASVVITMQGRRTYVAFAEYIPFTHASDIYHQYVLLNKHSPQVIALEAGL